MPEKLERCVDKVKKQGKSEDSAYGICVASTGIKKKKGGGWTKGDKKMKESVFDKRFNEVLDRLEEKKEKPSAGLSKKKISATVKKAKKGENIGKSGPGTGFKNVEKNAEKQGYSKEKAKKIAGAAMWKNVKR